MQTINKYNLSQFLETKKPDCSYHGEDLNVPTAFSGLWSSNNIKKKLNVIK